jgi:hypothetical protein
MFAMKYMNKRRTLEKVSIRNVLREIGQLSVKLYFSFLAVNITLTFLTHRYFNQSGSPISRQSLVHFPGNCPVKHKLLSTQLIQFANFYAYKFSNVPSLNYIPVYTCQNV